MNKPIQKSQLCVTRLILFTFTFLLLPCSSFAQTLAPGGPGKDAQWATAGKQAVGTSVTLGSKVWFTLAQGVMTEVYYPDVTVANVHKLELIIVDGDKGTVETESKDTVSVIEPSRNSLNFGQINTAKSGDYKIYKSYTVDPQTNTVLINIQFRQLVRQERVYRLYVYYDPSLNNSGMHDTAWSQGGALLASDGDKSSALVVRQNLKNGFTFTTNDFLGVNDGLSQILTNRQKPFAINLDKYDKAENGNVVQVGQLENPQITSLPYAYQCTLALSFGKNPEEALKTAERSLEKGFSKSYEEYEKGWSDYVKTLRKVEPKYQAQFNMAAMQLRALEDKTVRGANIASLTVPWGGDKNANENTVGGYHLVWSRDLYQAATAFIALGDKAAAERALEFLFKTQQKPDGSFPQNSFLDGKPFWGSLQLDEVAFPLILAYQLGKNDKTTYENHVKRAADFIVKTGPKTPQERWEEEGGYSPSTIAAEIAGLVCAADIARKNGDTASADSWLKTADEWQANIEKWTVTTNGKYSKEPYYVRITQNGKPDAGEKIELNNGAGFFDERDIVDAGFLELVRLGIKSPDDKIIQNSLKVVDQIIRVKTLNGDAFYRYNHDGYGEMDDGRRWNWDGKYTGKGRLWALLSGERGQYELALQKFNRENLKSILSKDGTIKIVGLADAMVSTIKPDSITKRSKTTVSNGAKSIFSDPKSRLDAMLDFANEGLMIPEQIWDSPKVPKNADKQFVPEFRFGEGTGSATPLAWSMAQFIRLAVNLQAGKNLDTPDVVYNRYVLGEKAENSNRNMENRDEPFFAPGESKLGRDFKKEDIKTLPSNVPITTLLSQGEVSIDNCYSDWWDKNKIKKLSKSPVIVKCKDGSFIPVIVYSGKGETVEVAGDFTGWKPQNLFLWKFQPYAPAAGDNLDFSMYRPLDITAPTARVEYKLIVDGKWITDPLNPKKIDNGVGGENSFFTMPGYQPSVWDNAVGQSKYRIDIEKINSTIYGEREIQVYVPEGFSDQNLPVLYLQDGTDYQKRAEAVFIQRNLVKANKLKPFIMIFLDPKDRMKEYWASDDYAKFVAEEVVPVIDAKFKTVKSPDGRAIMGASLGGITSVHTGLKYPQIFGRVGGQSSSWWIDDERVVKELNSLDSSKTRLKFYFDDGTLEGVEDSRKAVGILKAKNYDVTYVEGEAGHNWTAWRDRLADAFIALWQ